MFEAVIFDWDGTLADTRRVIVISFHKALAQIDIEVTSEYIERRIGIGAADTFREILFEKTGVADDGLVKRLVRKKSEVQIALAAEVPLFEGSRELLEALYKKFKVGLASMNNRDVIDNLLRFNCLNKYFQKVLTAEQVERSKPDPEIFLKMAKALNAVPKNCVIFEDSIYGVKAAKSAGMACVAVTTGIYKKEELEVEKPNLIVNSLLDPKILSFVYNEHFL